MDSNSYDNTIEERQVEPKQTLLGALREMPIVQVACKKAGIGRATYYRWKNENVEFARQCDQAVREGVDLVNDMSESQIIQLIKEKKLPAIALWLKHNNPRYGGKTAPRSPASATADLSPEEEKLFRKALILSGGTQSKYAKRNILKKSP